MNTNTRLRWLLTVLGLLTLATVTTASAQVPTPEPVPPPGYRRPLLPNQDIIITTEVRRYSPGAANHVAFATDRIGQEFTHVIVNTGFDAYGELYQRDALGNVIRTWRIDPGPEPNINKADAGTVEIVRLNTGQTAVRVMLTSHLTNSARPYILSAADILGTGAVFDPLNSEHGDNVPPLAPSAPGGDCPSLSEITAEFNRILDAKLAALVGNLRPQIRDQVRTVLREEGVLRLASSADERYAMLRHDTRDGAYEAARAWATTVALLPTPTPAPTPRP